MKNDQQGQVSYKLLQQLMERAWDEGDYERLMMLSHVVDQAMLLRLDEAAEDRNAI